jgi:hypothetical protein
MLAQNAIDWGTKAKPPVFSMADGVSVVVSFFNGPKRRVAAGAMGSHSVVI